VLCQEARFQELIIRGASSFSRLAQKFSRAPIDFYASLETAENLPQVGPKNLKVGIIAAAQSSFISNPMKKRAPVIREGNIARQKSRSLSYFCIGSEQNSLRHYSKS
jgi:hypothetical protein